jgi:alanyl-tRNA synthetase
MGDHFPEIKSQQELITKVITEEEQSFLKTLAQGIKKFEQYLISNPDKKIIDGNFAFELFDTYGFPVDLTQLLAREKNMEVDMEGFGKGLEAQKSRSRKAAEKESGDWIVLKEGSDKTEFTGYDNLEADVEIVKYRKVTEKKKEFYQLVFDITPFYAESGGQVGDRGFITDGEEKIFVEDTQKENDLVIHITKKLPSAPERKFKAVVDAEKRKLMANNHSATHLLHAALKQVLGSHVEQKGSLVDDKHLRFDFSHFSKLTDEELEKIEKIVNEKIRENISLDEKRNVPMKEALEMGATALFGEKYGEEVRVVTFDKDYSVELCGGTHVAATGQIGLFKITSESAIAAGVRRIEAVTAGKAEQYVDEHIAIVRELKGLLKNPRDIVKSVQTLIDQNNLLQKQMAAMNSEKAMNLKDDLKAKVENINGIGFIAQKVDLEPNGIRDLAFKLNKEVENMFLVLGAVNNGKVTLTVMLSGNLVKEKGLNAGTIIRELAREIGGGGGGQPHFATAGGKNPGGLEKAFIKAKEMATLS